MSPRPLPPLPDLPPEAFTEEYNDAYVEKYVYDADGIDRGLIWENLQRSPLERLRNLEGFVNSVAEVGEGSPATGVHFSEILRTLVEYGVEFVVVGATAANLRGVDISTSDLDIVFRQTAENRERLATALAVLDASYFDPAGRTIRPSAERLRDNRLNLLRTRLGRLDALSRIAGDWDYDELMANHAGSLALGEATIHVLTLEGLVAAKEFAGRPKDLHTLPMLRAAIVLEKKRDGQR